MPRKAAPRDLHLETLEPRVLFSGSPIPQVTVDATQPTTDERIQGGGNGLAEGERLQPETAGGTATAGQADEEMMEEHFSFTVQFDNAATGDDTGYSPYIDLVTPEALEMDFDTREFSPTESAHLALGGSEIDIQNAVSIGKVYNSADLAAVVGASAEWATLGNTNVWVDAGFNFSAAGQSGFSALSSFARNDDPTLVEHPIVETSAGLSQVIDANDYAVGSIYTVVRVPIGSIASGSPPIDVVFDARITQNPGGDPTYGAVYDEALTIQARGGFALGNDPANNPDSDPPIGHLGDPVDSATFSSDTITPKIVELVKRGFDETEIGPTQLIDYRLEVDIAAGQTVENLRIEDFLGDNLVYVPNSLQVSYDRIDISNGAPNIILLEQPGDEVSGGNDQFADESTTIFQGTDTPNTGGGQLTIVFDSVTGATNFVAGEYDETLEDDLIRNVGGMRPDLQTSSGGNFNGNIYITYQAYVAEFDANGAANLGGVDTDRNSLEGSFANVASVSGDWTDAFGGVISVGDNDTGVGDDDRRYDADHSDGEAVALDTEKRITARYDGNGNLITDRRSIPGDIIEYTLDLSAADFYAFEDLNLQDYLDDGHSYFNDSGLFVGDTNLSTSTFQTYWAVYQGGESIVGTVGAGGNNGVDISSVSEYVAFVDPHIQQDIALDTLTAAEGSTVYANDLNNTDDLGSDLLTWNLSSEVILNDAGAFASGAGLAQGTQMIALDNADVALTDDAYMGEDNTLIGTTTTVTPTITDLTFTITTSTGDVLTLTPDPTNPGGNFVLAGANAAAYALSNVQATNYRQNAAVDVQFDLAHVGTDPVLDPADPAITFEINAAYQQSHRFGALVDGDVDGDGVVDVTDGNDDGIADVSLDVDGDGLFDGIDVDGDGSLDLRHHVAGGLIDFGNGTNDGVFNPAAQGDEGDNLGYFAYYDAPGDKDGTGDLSLNDFVVTADARTNNTQADNANIVDGRAYNIDVMESDRVFIRFFARVDDSFVTEGDGTGDTDVGLRDTLNNQAIGEGREVEGFELFQDDAGNDVLISQETGDRVRNTGRTNLLLEDADFTKTLVAINGGGGSESILDQDPNDGVRDDFSNVDGSFGPDGNIDEASLKVGDTVTYRLRAELPFGTVENFVIRDFLPNPVFDVSQDYPNGVIQILDGASPAVYDPVTGDSTLPDDGQTLLGNAIYWNYGPDHNIPSNVVDSATGQPLQQILPFSDTPQTGSVYFDEASNAIVWDYGSTRQDAGNPDEVGLVLDILFTVEINNQAFDDNLELTNQAQFANLNSQGQAQVAAGIVGVELLRPDLNIVKGVIAVSPASGAASAPTLVGNDDSSADLANTGGGAQFAWAGSSEDGNAFNANDQDVAVGETTHTGDNNAGESLVSLIDGAVSAYLDNSNVIPGSLELEVDHNGVAFTLTDDGAGGLTLTNAATPDGSIVLNAGTIDYQSGEITIDSTVTTAIAMEFDQIDTTVATANDPGHFVSDNVPTTGRLLAAGGGNADNAIPGSIRFEVTENGGVAGAVIVDDLVDGNGEVVNLGDIATSLLVAGAPPTPNGTLYAQSASGTYVSVGQINYETGEYVFTVNVNDTSAAATLETQFLDATASTAITANATATDGVGAADLIAGAETVRAGSVVVTLATGTVLRDDIGLSGIADGRLYVVGGNGTPFGRIDYTTGDLSFDVDETLGFTATTYQTNSGPGIITSEYLHGVDDFANEGQLDDFADFVNSDVENVDAGDVLTYGIFVENVGGGQVFDLVVSDTFFTGLDDDSNNFQQLVATTLEGVDGQSTAETLLESDLNLQVWTGDGTQLVAGVDYNVEFTPGANVSGVDVTANVGTAFNLDAIGAVPAGDVFVPGSLEILVDGEAVATSANDGTTVAGDTTHRVTITDRPGFNNQNEYTGSGALVYHNASTNQLVVVGAIDYGTGAVTWNGIAIQDSDGNSVVGNAAALNFDTATLLSGTRGAGNIVSAGDTQLVSQLLPNGALASEFEQLLDVSEIVPGSTTVFVDYFGQGLLEFTDDGAGGLTLVGNPTDTIAGAVVNNVNGSIDYRTGLVSITWDDTWDIDITYDSTPGAGDAGNTAGSEDFLVPDNAASHNGSLALAPGESLIAGTVRLQIEDNEEDAANVGTNDTFDAAFATVSFLDNGQGGLVRDSNNNGTLEGNETFVAGAINYQTGDYSFSHSNAVIGDADPSVGRFTFESAAVATVANSDATQELVDGRLAAPHTVAPAGGEAIRPGTISIINASGHSTIQDDGQGNLFINRGGQQFAAGSVNYLTGEITISYAEFQDAGADYASTNAFRITFEDPATGILAEGRTAGSEVVNNESGSNVLVITYDLEVEDGFQPNEEFTNSAAIDRFGGSDGGDNLTINEVNGSVTVNRESDVATAEGRDVEVEKRLFGTDQAHTSNETFQIRTIDFRNGFAGADTGGLITVNQRYSGDIDPVIRRGEGADAFTNVTFDQDADGIGANPNNGGDFFTNNNTNQSFYNLYEAHAGENPGEAFDASPFAGVMDLSSVLPSTVGTQVLQVTHDQDAGNFDNFTAAGGARPLVDLNGNVTLDDNEDTGLLNSTRRFFGGSVGAEVDGTGAVVDDGSGLLEASQLIIGANGSTSPVTGVIWEVPGFDTLSVSNSTNGDSVRANLAQFMIVVDPGGPNEAIYRGQDNGGFDLLNEDPFVGAGGVADDGAIVLLEARAGADTGGIAVGDIIGRYNIDVDGEGVGVSGNDQEGQLAFIRNFNPTGAPVYINYEFLNEGNQQRNTVWHNARQPVGTDWSTEFTYSLVESQENNANGTRDGDEGDPRRGLSFVLQNDPRGTTAVANGGYGVGNGASLDPYVEIRFDSDTSGNNNDGSGVRVRIDTNSNNNNNQLSTVGTIDFDFGALVEANTGGATGVNQFGEDYSAATFDVQIDYDSVNEELTVVMTPLNANGDPIAPSETIVAPVNIANTLGSGDAVIGFASGSDLNGSAAAIVHDWEFIGTVALDEHHAAGLSNAPGIITPGETVALEVGEDVTIGEEVTYALVVEVPEGTTEHFTLTDHLPAGMELISVGIATTVADATNAEGVSFLDANFGGSVPNFTLDVGDDGTSTGGGQFANLAANGTVATLTGGAFQGPVDLTFRFEDAILNAHEDPQDATPDDPSDAPISADNNKFVVFVTARVLNGEDYNPASNGVVAGDSGVPDLNPALENTENGNPGTEGDLTNNATDDPDDHVDLQNGVTFGYVEADALGRAEADGLRFVEIDLVEPELKVDKTLVNFNSPLGPNEQAEVGETVRYTLDISHTSLAEGDAAQSTADAFNIHIFDNLAALGLDTGALDPALARITELEILSAPSYINGGNPVTLAELDVGTGLYVVNPAALGLFTTTASATRGIGTADANLELANVAGAQFGLEDNVIDFTLDRLELGDSIRISYTVELLSDQLLDVDVNGDADIENEARVTYYSVADITNPEIRESVITDIELLEAVGPEVDLNLVKGIIAVSPQGPDGATYTADPDSAGAATLGTDPWAPFGFTDHSGVPILSLANGGFFDLQSATFATQTEGDIGDAIHLEIDAAAGASLNNADPIFPGSVEVLVTPSGAADPYARVIDFYGDGDLYVQTFLGSDAVSGDPIYNEVDIDQGVVGTVNYLTGDLNFDIWESVKVDYAYQSATGSAVNEAIAGTTFNLANTLIAPTTVIVTDGASEYTDPSGNGILVDVANGSIPVGFIVYSTGEVALSAAPAGGATIDYDFFQVSNTAANEALPNAEDGVLALTETANIILTRGTVRVESGIMTLGDTFSDGRLFLLDTAGDPILVDNTGAVTADPNAAVSVGSIIYDTGQVSFNIDETVTAFQPFTSITDVSARYQTFTTGSGSNITSQWLHPDITDDTEWNQFLDRDLLEADGGVDAGDVVTYGIVVENVGNTGVFDINLTDALSDGASGVNFADFVENGVIDATALNMQVTRGDGQAVAFVLNYNAVSGELEIALDGELEAGAQTRNTDPNNALGTNVFLVTYDVEITDTFESGDFSENAATLTTYAFADNGTPNLAADLAVPDQVTDTATIEGKDPTISKDVFSTDQAHTDNTVVTDNPVDLSVPGASVTPDGREVVPGTLVITDGLLTVVDDSAGNLIGAYLGESINASPQLLNHNDVIPGSLVIHNTTLGDLNDADGDGEIAAIRLDTVIPAGFGTITGADIALQDALIEENSFRVTIGDGTSPPVILTDDGAGNLIMTQVLADLGPIGTALSTVELPADGIEPGSLVLTQNADGTTFTDDGNGQLVLPVEAVQVNNAFGTALGADQLPATDIDAGSLIITLFDGGPTIFTTAANGNIIAPDATVVGTVDFNTGAVNFTTVPNSAAANVRVDYTQRVATIDYADGDFQFLNTAINLDGSHVTATYDLAAGSQTVGTIDYIAGTVNFDQQPLIDIDTGDASNRTIDIQIDYQAVVGAIDNATGEVTISPAIIQGNTTVDYTANIGTIDYRTGVTTFANGGGAPVFPNAGSLASFEASVADLDPAAENVVAGEVVTYALTVSVPEGTTSDLVVTDFLPVGLELLNVSLVTTVAGSNGMLDADFTGAILANIDVNGIGTMGEGMPLAINGAIQGGTDVVFTFPASLVNVHDVLQDDDFADISDVPTSALNDTFLILLETRVLNGVEYNPLSNGANPADSGVADLDPAAENSVPAGSIVTNTAELSFTDGGGADEGAQDIDSNAVSIEVLQPLLEVSKGVTTANGSVAIGTDITYTIDVTHAAASSGDAFSLNVRDNFTEFPFAAVTGGTAGTQLNLTSLVVTRTPAVGSVDPAETVTIDIATGDVTGTASLVADIDTTASDLTNELIDFDVTILALGEMLTIEYVATVGLLDPATDLAMTTDDENTITPSVFDDQGNADPSDDTVAPGTDLNNAVSLAYYSVADPTNPENLENTAIGVATAEVISGFDLAITKDDGVVSTTVGAELTYVLTVENKAVHDFASIAGIPTSTATSVFVTDILPEFLDFDEAAPNAITAIDLGLGVAIPLTNTGPVTPANPGEFNLVDNGDGTRTITIFIGDMTNDATAVGSDTSNQVQVTIIATVNDLVPITPGSTTQIPNTATVASLDQIGDITPDDNIAIDTDIVSIPPIPEVVAVIPPVVVPELFIPPILDPAPIVAAIEDAGFPLVGGSQIFAGFVFMDGGSVNGEGFGFGGSGADEEDAADAPMTTVLPIYSGTADPGTVISITLYDANGNAIGTQTVVADAGGNWAAMFANVVLTDDPHQISISQTKPSWTALESDHGFNLRTYFAPSMNPSHMQSEELTVGAIVGRRLNSVAMEGIESATNSPQGNEDWRLRAYESLAESGVGGIVAQ